ncbi:aldolase/citrate lyase family protein [Pelagovum pacificum]|uniref:Hydroxypyruvate/pyruvate aldolase n=1 Tax=Pelagovum pacificum TaxID=2588711 RepID=A0A5C5GHY9_9RHOB|nr:aldolase/citrate lyase family protein [Pelagovum pacificum]QQA43011.1 4-hydroxy-2-oxo-heptane-1,7-dioate aldolase [Pelagovum pacificum]TNY33844.1 4-hydroxy-2-oxo-heptane-1,7-dioate aldolase [Pelagovum pacificum]
MDMPKNAFKAALKAGKRQIGLWVTVSDPAQVEMLAACGYDWLMLDTEHSPAQVPDVLSMMQAAAPYPVSCGVRPGWNDTVEIKRFLDAGAQTLLIPYVQNAEEARAAVAAVRYPPEGVRGVSGASRSSRFGMVKGYLDKAAEEICLLVQVESVEALGKIEEIAQVEGVDGIFIGPADLAASMGHVGNASHPDVKAAVLDGLRRIKAAGKPPGVLTLDNSFLGDCAEAGAQFIAVGLDMILLREAALSLRAEWAD